ncbi:MAG: hypothetical protein K2X34_09130, partial [Hyphomonadaceae bacterium]|nr:hypothetical protein [Hyphomonadaceae bacterium]
IGAPCAPRTWYRAVTYFVAPDAIETFTRTHARVEPGAIGFITDPRPNSYPRLPVRDESVFLSLTRHSAPPPTFIMPSALEALMAAPPHVLRLEPTARSLLQ